LLKPERTISAARHERRDVSERFIYGAVATMLGLLLVCTAATLWLYPQSRLDRILKLPLPRFPAPALQVDPSADMQRFHREELLRLHSRGWVDQQAGVAHIPIEEAMRQTARDGIPGWPP
jgi:hypothetical protein